jgi:hypothetical protein
MTGHFSDDQAFVTFVECVSRNICGPYTMKEDKAKVSVQTHSGYVSICVNNERLSGDN